MLALCNGHERLLSGIKKITINFHDSRHYCLSEANILCIFFNCLNIIPTFYAYIYIYIRIYIPTAMKCGSPLTAAS